MIKKCDLQPRNRIPEKRKLNLNWNGLQLVENLNNRFEFFHGFSTTTISPPLTTDNGSTNALLQIRSFCFELDGCPALHEYRPDISAFLHVHALGLPGFGAAEN